MGVRGRTPQPVAADYGSSADVQSFSTAHNEDVSYRGGDLGSRTQGGISGLTPRPLMVAYDESGGVEAVTPPPRSGYASIVRHGRGYVGGDVPEQGVRGTVFPEDRAGLGDAPASQEPHYIRRSPAFALGLQPVDADPDLVGRERSPLPRLTRFAMRFTMRHEAGSFAQRFSGLHTRVHVRARDRASKMQAPRSQRLTSRTVPRTFGDRTTVLT